MKDNYCSFCRAYTRREMKDDKHLGGPACSHCRETAAKQRAYFAEQERKRKERR